MLAVSVDQLKESLKESVKETEDFTESLVEERITSNNIVLQEKTNKVDLKVKCLEENLIENFEKNREVTDNIRNNVHDYNLSQSEQLTKLQSEMRASFNEREQQTESQLSNMEKRLEVDTENKISRLGMLFNKNVVIKSSNDTHFLTLQCFILKCISSSKY